MKCHSLFFFGGGGGVMGAGVGEGDKKKHHQFVVC